MNRTSDWLKNCLKDCQHEIFRDVVNITDCQVKPTGDGQVVIISEINRVTLTLETSSGEKKELQAIAKLEALTGPGREFATCCEAFSTEIMMYSDVLKSMEELMLEVGDKENLWPECYHYSDNNKLLLQDLSELGYKIVPTYHFLDLDHALLVMKSIGKFHGLSMVMKERGMIGDKHRGVPYYARKGPFMDVMQHKSLGDLNKVIKEKWGPEWSSVPDRLLKYFENSVETQYNAWISSNGKWDVLNHGDFSMRNMLFHYQEGSARPDAIKFVDFQMSHYSCLGNDLITLLYSSLKPSVREEHMEYLLTTYLEGLTSTTKLHAYTGRLPSLVDVQECIRSIRPLEMLTVIFTVPLFIRAGKKDLQKLAKEYFEKFSTCEDLVKAHEQGTDPTVENGYDDQDVTDHLKIDFERLLKENVI